MKAVQESFPHLTPKEVSRAVRIIFDRMTQQMADGGRIELRGFGSFSVRERRARKGRNPKNGSEVEVHEKAVPFFRTGKPLEERLNGK
jgi:integration host factor subunit beta